MVTMDQQPVSNDDQRIAERLRGTFGPTAADLFAEASDAKARGSAATTLVTAPMMREIEGAIRSVLEPSGAPAEPQPEPNQSLFQRSRCHGKSPRSCTRTRVATKATDQARVPKT